MTIEVMNLKYVLCPLCRTECTGCCDWDLVQELGERLTVSGPHQCLFETLREAWLGQLDEETRRVVEESLRWSAPWRFVAPKLGLSASRFGTLLDLAHRELWNVQLPTPDEEES